MEEFEGKKSIMKMTSTPPIRRITSDRIFSNSIDHDYSNRIQRERSESSTSSSISSEKSSNKTNSIRSFSSDHSLNDDQWNSSEMLSTRDQSMFN